MVPPPSAPPDSLDAPDEQVEATPRFEHAVVTHVHERAMQAITTPFIADALKMLGALVNGSKRPSDTSRPEPPRIGPHRGPIAARERLPLPSR